MDTRVEISKAFLGEPVYGGRFSKQTDNGIFYAFYPSHVDCPNENIYPLSAWGYLEELFVVPVYATVAPDGVIEWTETQ